MTNYLFNQRPFKERLKVTIEKGIFLTNYKIGEYGFNLYSINDFYVEVRINNDLNEIDSVKSFKSLNPLEPYLKDIDIIKKLQ